ncbi:MAG: polysaccharide biosynthesis/export family protein [Candidatus Sericytochromatia bacterium]|nr:polysaccharide biosynthesis/export family protein [Candidatus Sericytochromatia bacterium]
MSHLLTFILTLALLTAALPVQANPVQEGHYVLRYGDTVNLKVVENEKLELHNQPIRPDGRLTFPLIGEVQAGGLTLPQLIERVTKAYGRFFVDPHVVINVENFRPLSINAVGFLNKPGTYAIKEPVRLLQAIALAGGYDPRGNLTDVLVLRANGAMQPIDLRAVLAGKVEDNIWIYDGDTIRINEVSSPDFYRLLPPLAAALSITSTIIILILRI